MASVVNDIDWAKYGIADPAYTDIEWDKRAFRDAVGTRPCELHVDEKAGNGWVVFQWRTGVAVTPEQAQRLMAEVFTDPTYQRYAFYAIFPRNHRIYRLPAVAN